MLRFLLVSMYEFKQFLQIVLWIAIPGTVIAFLVTTFFHYKRKKKNAEGAEPAYMEGGGFHTVMAADPNANSQVPDWLASGTNPDNQPLIKKYEQEVRRYRENYATLEQDFRELEGKYSDLLNKAYSTEKQNDDATSRLQLEINGYKIKVTQLQQALDTAQANAKLMQGEQQVPEALAQTQQQVQQLQETVQQLQEKLRVQQELKDKSAAEVTRLENLMKNMEYSAKSAQSESEDLQRYYARQIDELGLQYKNEKSELTAQLQQLQKTIQQLNDEKAALQQKVQAAASEPKQGNYEQQIKELQLLLSKAEEEKTTLKNKITDQQYLQDVLQEKKLQIDFLQNQLEQRIKTFREIEKEAADKTLQVQQTQTQKENYEREMHALREELQQLQEEVAAWQLAVERSREEIRQHQENLRSKTGHIENLERNLHEVQQQQAVLQLVLDDKQNMITSLQESLNREQQKTKDLEGKLITNNQLLSKIYGDLSKSLSNPPASQQQNGTKLNGSGNNGSNGHVVNGNGFNLAGQH